MASSGQQVEIMLAELRQAKSETEVLRTAGTTLTHA